MDNIFYEEQSMKKYLLYVAFFGVFVGWIFLHLNGSISSMWEYELVMIAVTLVLMLILSPFVYMLVSKIYKQMVIRMNENYLSFGYLLFQGKWIIEIPYDEIEMIRFRKRGYWSIQLCKRYFFISKTGYVVEVDWKDKKQNGYSIIDHESFFKELRNKIDDSKIDYNPEKYL